MKLANVAGRATLLTTDDRGIDVANASNDKFGPSLHAVYEAWEAFRSWADTQDPVTADVEVSRELLGTPSPSPRQILAIGLNYAEHAAESGFETPDRLPPTFTKFASSLVGPDCQVVLPANGNTDWEVELVVVLGRTAHRVTADKAWDHVAGLTVGQDISERVSQLAGQAPQFSLGKSFPNFSPVGPWLVTPDEVADRDDLRLGCAVNGETVQDGRTKDMIFSVSELIAGLSATLTLYSGDIIFTGTPSGVGVGRSPQRFLKRGDQLHSWIEGVGELNQTFVADAEARP